MILIDVALATYIAARTLVIYNMQTTVAVRNTTS